MLFLAVYKFHNPSEELDKRTLKLFTNWQPPFEFKGHWARGDGQGGVAIFEADSAEQVLEGISPGRPSSISTSRPPSRSSRPCPSS